MAKASDVLEKLNEGIHPVQEHILKTAAKRIEKAMEDLDNLTKEHNVGGDNGSITVGEVLVLKKDMGKIRERILRLGK